MAPEALARIHESLEQWDDFLRVTLRQVQFEHDPAKRALLYFKRGSVMESKYHDDAEATSCYRSAVKVKPDYLPAIHSLRDLYARMGDWPAVVSTLKMEVAVWGQAKERADVLAQIAEVDAMKWAIAPSPRRTTARRSRPIPSASRPPWRCSRCSDAGQACRGRGLGRDLREQRSAG